MSNQSESFKAQFGEDQILAEYFSNKTSGVYVEVGAYDGVRDSNTFYFEQLGWRGVLVEADPELATAIKVARPNSQVFHCAVVPPDSPRFVTFDIVEGWKTMSSLVVKPAMLLRVAQFGDKIKVRSIQVPARTLDSVLEEANLTHIDFMTIDIEGAEWGALQGLNLSRWRPRFLLIERNTHLPDLRIMRRLHASGYRYLRTTGVNDWFECASSINVMNSRYYRHLLRTYYLPKYLTLWKPIFVFPIINIVRLLLIRTGLFKVAKSFLNRQKSDTEKTEDEI